MIVIVGNTKGGVGKTTLAVQIALARSGAGQSVLLIDADRQGSAQIAATMRAESGRPPLACVQLADGRLLRAQLGPLAAKHDDTIIDAGGRDNEALGRSAPLGSARRARAAACGGRVVARRHDRAHRPGAGSSGGRRPPPLRVLAALNLADPGDNRDTAETIEALAGFSQFTVAGTVIRRRKAVANAMATGLAAAEMQPRDPKACEEIEQLVSNVFNVTEVTHGNHTTIEAE